MWGSWFGFVIGGLAVVLLIVALAFGTSALLFPVLIALAIGGAIAVVAVLRGAGSAEQRRGDPRETAAPASGEGSGSPTSATGPRP
jgi:predicted lipid-binding transport protein (Tim44 family)